MKNYVLIFSKNHEVPLSSLPDPVKSVEMKNQFFLDTPEN